MLSSPWTRTTDQPPRWLEVLGRLRFLVIVLVGVLPAIWHVHTTGGVGDWVYFRSAAEVLSGRSDVPRLSLYVASPDTQIGPPALLAAMPLALLPEPLTTWAIAVLLGSALALACLLLERAAAGRAPDLVVQLTTLAGGAFAGVYWWRLAADLTHPEDVGAILVVCLVLGWVRQPVGPWTPWIAAVALGTAAAGKPWAVGFLPLAACWAGPLGLRVLRVVVGGLVAAAWWLPFVLAAPATPAALAGYRIDTWRSSPLALLDLAGGPYPPWVRPAQIALMVALAAVAVARGRVHLLPFAVVSGRLALDPQAWDYYFATVAVACLAADLLRTRWHGPWLTIATVVTLYDARWLADNQVSAVLQVTPLVVTCIVLAVPRPTARRLLRTGPSTTAAGWEPA